MDHTQSLWFVSYDLWIRVCVNISSLLDKTWFIVISELKCLVLFELRKWHGLDSTSL